MEQLRAGTLKLPKESPAGLYQAWTRKRLADGTAGDWTVLIYWLYQGWAPSPVQIRGSVLSWPAIDGVTSYELEADRIDDRDWDGHVGHSPPFRTWTANTTESSFPSDLPLGAYDVVIRRGRGSQSSYPFYRTTYLHHVVASDVTGLRKVDTQLVWDAVLGAASYDIQLYDRTGTLLANFSRLTTSAALDSRLGAGRFVAKVRAVVPLGAETRYTAWSVLDFAFGQQTPTNVRLDGTTLRWNGNFRDRFYKVSISISISISDGGKFYSYDRANPGYDYLSSGFVHSSLYFFVTQPEFDLALLPEIRQYNSSVRLTVEVQSSTSLQIISAGSTSPSFFAGAGKSRSDNGYWNTIPSQALTEVSEWSQPLQVVMPSHNIASTPLLTTIPDKVVAHPPIIFALPDLNSDPVRLVPFNWFIRETIPSFESSRINDAAGYGIDVDHLQRLQWRVTDKQSGNVISFNDAGFANDEGSVVFDNFIYYNSDFYSDPVVIYKSIPLPRRLVSLLNDGRYEIQLRVQYVPVVAPGAASPKILSADPSAAGIPIQINPQASAWSDWSAPTDLVVNPPGQPYLLLPTKAETSDPRPVFAWATNYDDLSFELSVVHLASGVEVIHEQGIRARQFQPAKSLSPGKYQWKLRPVAPAGAEPVAWSGPQPVEIFADPVIVTTGPATVDATPVISWTRFADTSQLIVSSYSIKAWSAKTGALLYSGTAQPGELFHRIAVPLPTGLTWIVVQANFTNGGRSAPGQLQANGNYLQPSVMIGVAPTMVHFKSSSVTWTPTAGATRYQVWITWIAPTTGQTERVVTEEVYSSRLTIPTGRLNRPGEYRVWVALSGMKVVQPIPATGVQQ